MYEMICEKCGNGKCLELLDDGLVVCCNCGNLVTDIPDIEQAKKICH
ncbi:MAG: hypothetical protein ACOC80_09170 [Petrotogales bacterium]